MRRPLSSVQIVWRRRSEYTRWTPRIDQGAHFRTYHFHTLHLTVGRLPEVYQSGDLDGGVKASSSDEDAG